ncbi:MAG: hypothetical protein KatS3mg132_553 [Limisphaera sp.]|nr:MAG: hypothetical protein KatS3mg132_553 [Limisphaera sp.]
MQTTIQPKNRWLIRMRNWHRWIGVVAALFMVVFAVTGMILNYKKPVLGALGLMPDTEHPIPTPLTEQQRAPVEGPSLALTTTSILDTWPVPPSAALARARAHWGDVPLEKLELKLEHGHWVWKIKQPGGKELQIHAATGRLLARGPYEKFLGMDASGAPVRKTDWGKILLDLHTGKIAGPWGKAIMTAAGAGLLFLTLSGLYVWVKPLLLRRRNARLRTRAHLSATTAIRAPQPETVELAR